MFFTTHGNSLFQLFFKKQKKRADKIDSGISTISFMVLILFLKIVHEEIIKLSIRQILIFKKTLLYARPNASLENYTPTKFTPTAPVMMRDIFHPKWQRRPSKFTRVGLLIYGLSSCPTQIRPQQLVKKPAIISGEESYESSAHLMV